MENECDEMTESEFKRWVMRNFSEVLKEHILSQCKATKNLEKTLDEMLTRSKQLREEYKRPDGAEKHSTRISLSIHKFQ